jgi:hypothetical protein
MARGGLNPPKISTRRPPIIQGNSEMAPRTEIKVNRRAPDTEANAQLAPSQHAKAEVGNYRLQVDRQTKNSYVTQEAAEEAGLVIKKAHPIVQVSIYNSSEGVNKIIELPT